MSPSVAEKPPMRRQSSRRSVSLERDRSPPPRRRERSPVASSRRSRSPPHRERSPDRHKSSYRESGRVNSSKQKSRSPISRSVSPRTKRLRRVQAEKEVAKVSEREHERNHGKRDDKSKHERSYKERDLEKEVSKERRERKPELESKSERSRDRDRTRDREVEKDRDKDALHRASSRSKHRRSESPPSDRHHHRSRHHSRSPPRPASRSRVPDEDDDSRVADHRDDESDAIAQMKAAEEALETKEKQKPSFELSGKLAEETNRVRGVTLLFTEPPDARKPDVRWRLYVFKGGEVLNEPLYVHRQSCYLFGRERRVADIPTDHPSCSKQHAVLQYRQVEVERPDGMMAKQTKPYLMDLGSTNKTFINEAPIEPQRYYELFEKDTIKFGNSSREYVLLHENSMS
ncbi:hypothetical protein RND81_12G200700 [Saponaria officinalis]|uniref:FHA domain-containing protein n=1 Tax=Saponaria officinalis TaxID=3572 RepID=A0AAW1HD00_SAPOF